MKENKTLRNLCSKLSGKKYVRNEERDDLKTTEPQLGIDYTQEQLKMVNEMKK